MTCHRNAQETNVASLVEHCSVAFELIERRQQCDTAHRAHRYSIACLISLIACVRPRVTQVGQLTVMQRPSNALRPRGDSEYIASIDRRRRRRRRTDSTFATPASRTPAASRLAGFRFPACRIIDGIRTICVGPQLCRSVFVLVSTVLRGTAHAVDCLRSATCQHWARAWAVIIPV